MAAAQETALEAPETDDLRDAWKHNARDFNPWVAASQAPPPRRSSKIIRS